MPLVRLPTPSDVRQMRGVSSLRVNDTTSPVTYEISVQTQTERTRIGTILQPFVDKNEVILSIALDHEGHEQSNVDSESVLNQVPEPTSEKQ